MRKRLLGIVPLSGDDGPGNGLLGDERTVDLTARAVDLFWPDRSTRVRAHL